MRLAPAAAGEPGDMAVFKSLVIASARPVDRLEHVHVQAVGGGGFDVVLFTSVTSLAVANVNGAALCSRLLSEHLPGWQLLRVAVDPAV
ncbi:MAG TPA: hypothetical protein VIY52_17855 [Streptosporangiaceae bacterium]